MCTKSKKLADKNFITALAMHNNFKSKKKDKKQYVSWVTDIAYII